MARTSSDERDLPDRPHAQHPDGERPSEPIGASGEHTVLDRGGYGLDWSLPLSDVKRTGLGREDRCARCDSPDLSDCVRLSYNGRLGDPAKSTHSGPFRQHGEAWTDAFVCPGCASEILRGRSCDVFGPQAASSSSASAMSAPAVEVPSEGALAELASQRGAPVDLLARAETWALQNIGARSARNSALGFACFAYPIDVLALIRRAREREREREQDDADLARFAEAFGELKHAHDALEADRDHLTAELCQIDRLLDGRAASEVLLVAETAVAAARRSRGLLAEILPEFPYVDAGDHADRCLYCDARGPSGDTTHFDSREERSHTADCRWVAARRHLSGADALPALPAGPFTTRFVRADEFGNNVYRDTFGDRHCVVVATAVGDEQLLWAAPDERAAKALVDLLNVRTNVARIASLAN